MTVRLWKNWNFLRNLNGSRKRLKAGASPRAKTAHSSHSSVLVRVWIPDTDRLVMGRTTLDEDY